MKAYDVYKPSGVEWLGNVPAHWSVKNLKYVVTYNDDVLPENTDADFEIEYVEISDVDEVSGIKNTEIMLLKDAPSRARRLVAEGDIIISTVRTYLRALAVINNPPDNMVVSTGFAVLRPVKINQRYARYAVSYDGFVQEVIARSNGVSYPAINASDLVRIPITIPSPSEQQAIADYLDVETARIDGLIEAKHELINLLVEYRQSVISDAVLKGLNPDVSFKPFFSDWVDTIPAHWGQMRLGHIAKIYAGGTPDRTKPEYWDGDIPWINSGSVNQWLVTEASENITHLGWEQSSARWVPKGSLVIALAGQGKTKGMCAQMAIDATCNQSMAAIVLDSGNNRYLLYWLTANYKNIRGMASDDLRDGLNLVMIGQIPIPFPSISEQDAISEYLDIQTAHLDELLKHTEAEIDLLKELRASTIVDAVLGRVRVI